MKSNIVNRLISSQVPYIFNVDSYKASHFLQMPEGADGLSSYIESRGGQYDKTLMFGLSMILKSCFQPITAEEVEEAKVFYAAHGLPFDADAFMIIVNEYGGMPPLRIEAAPEGSLIPVHNVLAVIESTDSRISLFSIGQFLETLIMRVWYPITVATRSFYAKKIIYAGLIKTSDDPEGQIPFKLHDFGARGVSSTESSMIGGLAHLVNFMGTDTVAAVLAAKYFYSEEMAGYSIPASEHSTITSWGRAGEVDAYRNMLEKFGGKYPLIACVSDTYNVFEATSTHWGKTLKQEVIDSGSMLVIRPDSGDPAEIVRILVNELAIRFGTTVNKFGFKVLNNVRIIQGDGINLEVIEKIISNLIEDGFSVDNVAFGMGGHLLQSLNRDTQKMAMKASAVRINGNWIDICKSPITDTVKVSKKGRQMLYKLPDGSYKSGRRDEAIGKPALQVIYENGKFFNQQTLKEIRQLAHSALVAEVMAS